MRSVCSPVPAALWGLWYVPLQAREQQLGGSGSCRRLGPCPGSQGRGPSSEHQPRHYSAPPPPDFSGCSCKANASDRIWVVAVIFLSFVLFFFFLLDSM